MTPPNTNSTSEVEPHEPPLTLKKQFCPKCGQIDGVRSLKTRHYSRGSLCDGVPITVEYRRAPVAGPGGDAAFIQKVAALPCARVDGDECFYFEKEVAHYCASCHAKYLIETHAAASSPTPAEGESRVADMAEPKSEAERICVHCQRQVESSEYGPPINDTVWSHIHNGVVWCHWPTTPEKAREIYTAPPESTVAGERAEHVKDAIIDGAIGCRNCGDTWERDVSAEGIVAPCEDCGDGAYNLAAPATPPSELQKLRQAIGWICDAADAAYIEDSDNKRIHEIFNIAAQAAGLKRRLPDEHGRYDEASVV